MALRLNLYGCSIDSVLNLIQSGNQQVENEVAKELVRIYEHAPEQIPLAQAWLHTLIHDGHPTAIERSDKETQPADGGLVLTYQEAEHHIAVFDCLVRFTGNAPLDLSGTSSDYHVEAYHELYREAKDCGFSKSRDCPTAFFTSMDALLFGTPVFGNSFRTNWSFYSLFRQSEIDNFVDALKAAIDFQREFPDYLPEEFRAMLSREFSPGGKELARCLIDWFSQIRSAQLDAYIIWY